MAQFIIDNFTGGLAPSNFYGDWRSQASPGNWSTADYHSRGWDAQNQPGDIGLLRRGFGEGSITNVSTITGGIKWFAMCPQDGVMYALEDYEGLPQKIHKITLSNSTVANASPWPYTITGSTQKGTGMVIFNNALYWACGRNFGTYNFSLTFNNTLNMSLGIGSFGSVSKLCEHPMVVGNGQIFIGDADANNNACVSTYNGSVFTKAKLDLSKTNQVIKALAFNGNYLYIAASGSDYQTNTLDAPSTMYIWDTTSGSWQQQYRFPEQDFNNLIVSNGKIIGIGRKNAYIFNGSGFDQLYPLVGGASNGSVDVSPYGQCYWIDQGLQSMFVYGTINPQVDKSVRIPIFFNNALPSALKWTSVNEVNVGFSNSGSQYLRRYNISATDFQTSTYKTPIISSSDLGFGGNQAHVTKVIIDTLPLVSGCSVDINWYSGDGTASVKFGTINPTNAVDPTNPSKFIFQADGAVDTDFQFGFTHSAGDTPKIHHLIFEANPEKN